MEFTKLKVDTNYPGIELLTGMFTAAGVTGCTVCDPREFEEFLDGRQTRWDYIEESLMALRDEMPSVTVYIPKGEQGSALLSFVLGKLEVLRTQGIWGSLAVQMDITRDEDWAENWKQYFKPLTVGDKLLIKPSWEESPENDGRIIVEIDPASSFGTGTHHTTQLCLALLEKMPVQGTKVLDMGCGSGILGVAASLLGASSVTMVDIDENAVATAAENAKKNNIESENLLFFTGDVTGNAALKAKIGDGYDIVLANIVADVIIDMREELKAFMKEGGLLAASGIIDDRANDVKEKMVSCGLKLVKEELQGGWVAFLFER